MAKRLWYLAVIGFVVFCFMASSARAQCGPCGSGDYGAKVKALKAKQNQMRDDFQKDVEKANKETNSKMR